MSNERNYWSKETVWYALKNLVRIMAFIILNDFAFYGNIAKAKMRVRLIL